jgi:hypothetical protein
LRSRICREVRSEQENFLQILIIRNRKHDFRGIGKAPLRIEPGGFTKESLDLAHRFPPHRSQLEKIQMAVLCRAPLEIDQVSRVERVAIADRVEHPR